MNEMKFQEIPQCAVCCNELTEDLNATRCGHVFHRECIEKSILMNSRCPICRKPVEKNNVINLTYKITDKTFPVRSEQKFNPHNHIYNPDSEENFDLLKEEYFLALDKIHRLENKIENIRKECIQLKNENNTLNIKLSEEKINIEDKNIPSKGKEEKQIKERAKVFESLYNPNPIEKYFNQLNQNRNFTHEHTTLSNKKENIKNDTCVIDLSSKQNNVVYLSRPEFAADLNIDQIEENPNYIEISEDVDETDEITTNKPDYHSERERHKFNPRSFLNNPTSPFVTKTRNYQNHSELWQKSDLITYKNSENKKQFIIEDGDSPNDKCDNIAVELDEFNSRLTAGENSKSPFKNRFHTFIKNKPDLATNNMTTSPSYSNILKQFTVNESNRVNLNSELNLSNFSAMNNNNYLNENSRQSVTNLVFNNSSFKESNNNSNNKFNFSRSYLSEESPLGKKNKRKYSRLKSLDKNQNTKQMTITSMLSLKNK